MLHLHKELLYATKSWAGGRDPAKLKLQPIQYGMIANYCRLTFGIATSRQCDPMEEVDGADVIMR